MNIVYFFVGNSMVINMQVAFSIRTFLAQMTKDDTIYVVTDTPLMYATSFAHSVLSVFPVSTLSGVSFLRIPFPNTI